MPHGRRHLPNLVGILDPVLRASVVRVSLPDRSIPTPTPSLPRWALLLGVGLLAIQGAISLLNVATWDGVQVTSTLLERADDQRLVASPTGELFAAARRHP